MDQLQQFLQNKMMPMQPCPSAIAQGFNYMLPQMSLQSLPNIPQMMGNHQINYMIPQIFTAPNPSSSHPHPLQELQLQSQPLPTLSLSEILPLSMSSSPYQGRMRTIFTKVQVAVMEAVFQIDRYPEHEIRRRIAEEIDLDESRVTTWYKNRRCKERQAERQMQKKAASANMDMTSIKIEPDDKES